jgi:hypothetical protein
MSRQRWLAVRVWGQQPRGTCVLTGAHWYYVMLFCQCCFGCCCCGSNSGAAVGMMVFVYAS